MDTRKLAAPVVGLAVAWGGTALLVGPASGLLGDPASITTQCLGLAFLWLLFAVVIWIVIYLEREPLSSLWLKPLRWQSAAWGVILFAAFVWLIFPATEIARNAAGLHELRQDG